MTEQTITTTRKHLYSLQAKAKTGWRYYYDLREKYDRLSSYHNSQREQNRILIKKIQSNEAVDLTFLKKQFIELYEKVGELTDCPICFETITKETMELGNCGHPICKECYERCIDCPICRKAYYKSSPE